jgi:shikimate kinase
VHAVLLIGFMGSGKTCVGLALSRALNWSFQDLDLLVEAQQSRSISEIFHDSGEREFRRAECEALSTLLKELSPSSPAVIALGGGAFVQPEVRELLAKAEIPIVWLDAPADELWQRCVRQSLERPLAKDQNQFRQLYEVRRKHYTEAGIHIDTSGKEVDRIAEEVVRRLRLRHLLKEK